MDAIQIITLKFYKALNIFYNILIVIIKTTLISKVFQNMFLS